MILSVCLYLFAELVDRLRNGIIDLVDSECPAPAAMLYDEFWTVIDLARPLVEVCWRRSHMLPRLVHS